MVLRCARGDVEFAAASDKSARVVVAAQDLVCTHGDSKSTRHPGYALSQGMRKRDRGGVRPDEDGRGLRKTRYRARDRVRMHAYLVAAAYNL